LRDESSAWVQEVRAAVRFERPGARFIEHSTPGGAFL
jgi:hypothetical protein